MGGVSRSAFSRPDLSNTLTTLAMPSSYRVALSLVLAALATVHATPQFDSTINNLWSSIWIWIRPSPDCICRCPASGCPTRSRPTSERKPTRLRRRQLSLSLVQHSRQYPNSFCRRRRRRTRRPFLYRRHWQRRPNSSLRRTSRLQHSRPRHRSPIVEQRLRFRQRLQVSNRWVRHLTQWNSLCLRLFFLLLIVGLIVDVTNLFVFCFRGYTSAI